VVSDLSIVGCRERVLGGSVEFPVKIHLCEFGESVGFADQAVGTRDRLFDVEF
jgi:hypothetical protein